MRHAIPIAFLFAASLPALGADPPKVEEFAPHASGVALAEVVKVEKFDGRSNDGPAGVRFHLKRIRGTGDFRDFVEVYTAFGGLFADPFKPVVSKPMKPDSLKKGERWWFAFASDHDAEKYDQGVIGFWTEKDAKVESLEEAVKADAYSWKPRYDPTLKLSYGHLVGKGKWRVRGERDGKVLWTQELPGKPTDTTYQFGLYLSPGGDLEVPMPKCEQILLAETHTRLEKGNEFGLEPGPYYVTEGLDPETGRRHGAWVRLPQGPSVALAARAYDPATGKVTREHRYDFLKTGGKAAGAKTEDWYRMIDRTFDATGKVTKEETFRHDQDQEAGKRWVKVGK